MHHRLHGPIIPFIIYCVTANVSIGALFLGGVFPGLLLGAALTVYVTYVPWLGTFLPRLFMGR